MYFMCEEVKSIDDQWYVSTLLFKCYEHMTNTCNNKLILMFKCNIHCKKNVVPTSKEKFKVRICYSNNRQ